MLPLFRGLPFPRFTVSVSVDPLLSQALDRLSLFLCLPLTHFVPQTVNTPLFRGLVPEAFLFWIHNSYLAMDHGFKYHLNMGDSYFLIFKPNLSHEIQLVYLIDFETSPP